MLDVKSLRRWRDEIGRHVLHLDFEPYGDQPFRAGFDPVFDCDGVRVTHVWTSAGTTTRKLSMLHLEPPSRDLVIAKRPLVINQGGREISLRAGDATFLRNWVWASSSSPIESAYTVLVLPLAGNAELEAPDVARDGVLRRSDPALQLLRSHIQLLQNKKHRRLKPELQAVARRGLTDLAALLIRAPGRETTAQSVRETRTGAAIAYVERHFCEPGLNSIDVAAALGISVRYVNRLFEMSGRSLTDRLLDLRLNAARHLLVERGSDLKIAEIAQHCGFTDISAFNRRFRSRFGGAPGTFKTH